VIVNKKELAEIIGISERSLTEWQKEGLPVASYADNRGQANEYDKDDGAKYFDYLKAKYNRNINTNH